jgi:Fe-S oxidoreductase
MAEQEVKLDVTEIENFIYDMSTCVKCKGCFWVDHIYMHGIKFSYRCPSAEKFLFDSYGSAYGRFRTALGVLEGKLDYSDRFLGTVYNCTMCGACDTGCKRNLDLEVGLTLEAIRIKCVQEGKGPMPEHKKIAKNIAKNHNRYGSPHANRSKWLPSDVKPSAKADIVYFVGCNSSYVHTEIAQATAKILASTNTKFMLLDSEEWCCGYPLYSTGQVDAFKKQVEHNIEAVKKAGASTVLVSCAEGYKTWKVDYPKILGKSTDDMGFKVVHLVEHVDQLLKAGSLKFNKPISMKATYHDSCNLARLSEPWIPWEGTRGQWGVVTPPLQRRRGTNGIYQQPRDILSAIPGLELEEMIRIRENALCCGAGGGVRDAFKDFALWTANERLEEVREIGAEAIISACPYCKDNFSDAVKAARDEIKVYDISELIWQAISK